MRWRFQLSEFNFRVQYNKEFESCQADALSGLRKNAEAWASTAKLDISSLDALDVSQCRFIPFESGMTDNLLSTQPASTK